MDLGRGSLAGALGIGASLILGCGSDPVDPEAPRIHAVVAGGVSGNVLAALVTVESDTADSLVVRYGVDAPGTPLDSTTPAFPSSSPSTSVPVLGLEPDRAYRLQVTVWRGALAA